MNLELGKLEVSLQQMLLSPPLPEYQQKDAKTPPRYSTVDKLSTVDIWGELGVVRVSKRMVALSWTKQETTRRKTQ